MIPSDDARSDEVWAKFGQDPAEQDPEPLQGPDDISLDRVGRLKKAPTAFRTISEVADDLHVPQHVLRFWETRFPQVKPLKRGGGRRYYRPDDVVLLRRISDLLYVQGYTIKGVQRLLIEGDGGLQGELPPPDHSDAGDLLEPPPPEPEPQPPSGPLIGGPGDLPDPGSPPGSTPQSAPGSAPGSADDLQLLREAFRETLSVILTELEAIRRQLPA
jgi:DNA-binding transcriptional MerR regulator